MAAVTQATAAVAEGGLGIEPNRYLVGAVITAFARVAQPQRALDVYRAARIRCAR